MIRILFVCTGNICRSPTAVGVFRRELAATALADLLEADSAGTLASRAGEAPDPRAAAAALRRGVDIRGLRARALTEDDFFRAHYLLAMDRTNMAELARRCPPGQACKLKMFTSFTPRLPEEVPDPYGRDERAFERALDLIEAGTRGLLLSLERELC